MRNVPAGVRVFAGAGDGQHTFRLQQFQRIGRVMRALLLHDGQHLVLEVGFAHVKERLAGHGGVLNALFFGQEREHSLHQRTLARS